ncbi:DUF6084 family protein [Streptosporangium sp. NPDC051022]|uniref:DUF6084 family protein n=1 Tax=Streptosporangium sp. NPDC051022 TaxID=3155752 RepID=UPI00342823EA
MTDLPVPVRREPMDPCLPESGWLRLRRETLRALPRFKSGRALATWDEAVATPPARTGEASR